jgi:CRP-like cAMP-binding protein
MTSDDIAIALKRSSLFGRLNEDELYSLAARSVLHAYRHGQPVFFEGDAGHELFLVMTGMVKLFVSSAHGDEVLIGVRRPGDAFGEIAVIDGGVRSATAEAIEDSYLVLLSREVIVQVVREQPSVAEALLWMLGDTLRRLTDRTADLVFLDLPGRLAKLLLTLAEAQAHGAACTEPISLNLRLTQSDLANLVGGSRPAVNRILADYERRRIIVRRGRALVLLRPDALRRPAVT